MKRLLIALVCCMAWLASPGHAEPARKATAGKAVDLDAAAKATAALYAAPAARPPQPASALQKVPAVPVPSRPVRSSPLLPPAVATPATVLAEPATDRQQAADEFWSGAYHCEHAEKVSLRPGMAPDQIELQWKAQRWQMRRVDSRSGALRLEDTGARMVWIQLGHKSMLLDQRQGKRLLDECQHDVQVETAARMKNNPPPALFDTSGIGR